MAPFPVYDTEYVAEVENKIKEMEAKNNEYDELPVVACRHCKSLHVVSDELDNSICMRCGSVNELQEFENIYKYKEFKDAKDS
jgi:DNA-directed RNA polymerase subunit RPC12/RpoP